MDRARIQFLFGDADVDPDDPDLRSDLLFAGDDDRCENDDAFDEDAFDDDAFDDDEHDDPLAGLSTAVREVIVAQIARDDPPEVWAAAQRLLELGMDRHPVMSQLAMALLHATRVALGDEDGEGVVTDRYREYLASLPLPSAEDVAEAVTAVIAEHQPVGADEAERLALERLGGAAPSGVLRGVARDEMVESLLDRVVDNLVEAEETLEYLPGDLLVDVGRLTSGIVLTHRLTDPERELDALTAGFDLAGFHRRDGLHLAGGDELDDISVEDGHLAWQGPDGWLEPYRAGALLAVRVADEGLVDVTELAEDPPPHPDLVARLRSVYDAEVAEPGLPVGGEELVLGLLAGDRRSFDRPRPPLSELSAAAGLEQRGGFVAHDESVWQAGAEHRRGWRVFDALEPAAARVALRILEAADAGHPDEQALADTLGGLGDPRVADVVLDELVPPGGLEPDETARAARWAERLLTVAASPAQVALARWAAAVVAERSGDVLAAEAHLALATEAHPTFEPAVERAAWYASDRGDAARAVRLWRRLETPNPATLDIVEPFTRPASEEPGRNEPCWCGSGRKYKTCHLGQRPVAPLADRVGWLCRKAVDYLEHQGGQATADGVACALARAIDPDDPESIAEALDDPIVLDAVLTEGGWFEHFVEDRGPLLPDDEALLAAAWTLCRRTVYEIVAATPGAGLTVTDLRTGDRLDLRERTFSRQARPGTLVCARAVPDGETHQFVGGVFPVAPGREADVLGLCDDGDPEELCRWVRALHQPPTLLTRENEPIVACRAVVAVNDPALARKVLDDRYEPEGGGWVELFDIAPDEQILRATLELDGDRLSVATHSEARLDRVLDVLRTELPGAAVVSEDRRPLRPGEMPEAPRLPGDEASGAGGPLPLGADEHAAVVVQIQEQMERRWLDEAVPALAGLTPRQAAADPTRREQLERLVDSYPDPEPDAPFFGLRPERLRALLGLRPHR